MTKWRFDEPVSGDSYVFEIGPDKSSGGTYQRSAVFQNRGAADGSTVLTVSRSSAREEECSGTLLTSSQYYALADWFDKGLTVQITDDLNRTSNVLITGYEPKRERKGQEPWYHTF